jgi:hypothetical protein
MAYPTVKLKRSSVIGRVPDSSQLAYGELAINYEDGKLYWKSASNIVKGLIIDSDQVDGLNRVLFDQEFTSRTTDSLGEGSINRYYTFARSESDITNIVDSAYIQFLQLRYLDSAKTIDLIDSAYIQARQSFGAGIDSADIILMIDSAYVNARLNRSLFLDSAEAIDLIDSAYVQARQVPVTTATVNAAAATTVGTITSGTWNGTAIAGQYGGTGVANTGKTITLGGSFTHTGAHTLGVTTTANTDITLPTTGTLATTSNKLSAFAATTSSELLGVISDETGSGALVFATSPALTTPVLGVASATSINKVALTAPATGSTLTIADGKTLTASNTLTFTGTDGTSVAFGTGGTVVYTADKLSVHAATTSAELAGVISDETGSGALVFATSPTLTTPTLGIASATTINKVTLTAPATGSTLTIANGKTLTASNTLTFTGTDSSSVAFGTGGTVAYTGSTLAQFAATTSLQLKNVISDETGSGALVFGTTPTLTTPIITTSFSLDSNVFHNQTYGLSINVDSDLGDSTQTSYLFGTKGLADSSVVIGLGRDGHFFNVIGTAGTILRNRLVIGSQFSNTDFEIRNNLGAAPVNLSGGTLLFKVDSNGNASIPSSTSANSKTTGALVLVGGIGTQNNIYANEIYSSTVLSGGTITGKYLGFNSDFGTKLTTNLTEGTNKYYTKVRFDSDFGSKSTSNLTEGSNKYYTTVRADSDAKKAISHSNVSGFGSISYSNTTGVISYTGPTTANVRQAVSAGNGINYDSPSGVFSLPQAVGTTDSVQFSGLSVSNNVVIDGNLFVFGTQTITSTSSLSVTTPFIRVADSNTANVVDIGLIGQYSVDSGVTARFTGLIRDATNSEYYLFNNLVQNTLNDSNPPVTIDVGGTGWQLSTLNIGTLKGKYFGFDSDAKAFNKNFLVKTSNYTAVSGDKILANTGGGSFSITLPAGPTVGDNVAIYDINNWATNNLNVLKNGSTIEGFDSDFVLDIGQIKVELIYGNSTWHIFASVGPEGPVGATGPAGPQGESASTSLIAGLAIALS